MVSKRQRRRASGKAKAKARAARPKLIPLSKFPNQVFENHGNKRNDVHRHAAFRLILDAFEESAQVLGSATVLDAGILATAKHVISDFIKGQGDGSASNPIRIDRRLYAVQVLPEGEIFWQVTAAELH
jgi:hypothetical protein